MKANSNLFLRGLDHGDQMAADASRAERCSEALGHIPAPPAL